MDKYLKKRYSKITKKEIIREIRLIEKESKPLRRQYKDLQEDLKFLNHKLVIWKTKL